MIFEKQPSHLRTLNRMAACLFTAKVALAELEDPVDFEKRADLLIASEDLLRQVTILNEAITRLVWEELDQRSHPSSEREID